MGYYTRHDLDVIDGRLSVIEELRELCESAEYALDEFGDCAKECKWYNCNEDMIEFSKLHPEMTFKIHFEGEEANDIYDTYYKDGKMQTCKAIITIPPMDEKKWV